MPPNDSKAPRNDEGPADLSATPPPPGLPIELRRDEKDAQNVAYHASLLEALKTVEGHPLLFEGIGDEEPLRIARGGALAPFNQKDFMIDWSEGQLYHMPLRCMYFCLGSSQEWVPFSGPT